MFPNDERNGLYVHGLSMLQPLLPVLKIRHPVDMKRSSSSPQITSKALASLVLLALPAAGELLVYEPFAQGDVKLTGQAGGLGTVGTWVSNDTTNVTEGWQVHPEGLSGVAVNPGFDPANPDTPGILVMFDGTVANLPTSGGYAGMVGPEDRDSPGEFGLDSGTGNLDASIGLAPSVTATFVSGTTTWFSYVGAHAWDRNQSSPTLTIGTDPTTLGSRGLNLENNGNGISASGGPPRFNLFDVYPHYFREGVHHQAPGGYLGGVLGDHNGIVSAFVSTPTGDGVLGDDDVMPWTVSDEEGFGAPNIVVGKIEWDADEGGYDIITVVNFSETDEITEENFNALVELKPNLSSKNWPEATTPADPENPSNKPDLDQSQFDTLNISGLKFFIDEIRIGTTFASIIGGEDVAVADLVLSITSNAPASQFQLSWPTREGRIYNLRSSPDLTGDFSSWTMVEEGMEPSGTGVNVIEVDPGPGPLFYRVEEVIAP